MQTRQSITAALRPFVNAKLERRLRNTCVDLILTWGEKCNADVRDLTDEGVVCFFYSGCETTPWTEIVAVRIRELDEDGTRIATRLIERDAADRRLAA